MKRAPAKSDCPINYSLEILGDTWSLLIVRDIVLWGKHTYKEFLESDEGISTNMLAARLAHLEHEGIIARHSHPSDRRQFTYSLTPKGLDLIPIVLGLASWGATYGPRTADTTKLIAAINANPPRMLSLIRQTVQDGGAIFAGKDSVVSRLNE